MTNLGLKRLLNKRPLLAKNLKAVERQITKLCRDRERLAEKLVITGSVTEFYKGVALSVSDTKTTWYIRLVLQDSDWRSAWVYLNAHNESTFGVRLVTRAKVKPKGFISDEMFCGAHWPDKNECLKLAKEWVAFGRLPEEI